MLSYFEFTTVYIGPIPIQVWGFWVALGIAAGTWMLVRAVRPYNVPADRVLDVAMYILVGAFVGARLTHVFFYEPLFFWTHPVEIIKIWHGGLSSFGGFFGALIGFLLYRKRQGFGWLKKKVTVLRFADFGSLALLVGWVIGRIGCVMIHDHPGVLCDCTLAFDGPDGGRLDMAFIEILALLPLLVFFVFTRKKARAGTHFSILLIYYGALRFVLDFYRATDVVYADTRYLGLTPAQYFSIVMAVVGVAMYSRSRK
jgi:phosphatidylglycerol---prolipoprotein diacylglyceryl transferase